MINNIEEIKDIVNFDIIRVYNEKNTAINVNNSGSLNEQYLNTARNMFIKETALEYLETFVDTYREYPISDIVDVKMTLDVVVIPAEKYEKIQEFINSFNKAEELTSHE